MLDLNLIKENRTQLTDEARRTWLDPKHMPPWRQPKYKGDLLTLAPSESDTDVESRGSTFIMPPTKDGSAFQNGYDAINAALLLRRPILVKGPPGIGKSSLAYYLAYILGLGKPLVWPINSRSTLQEGLYFYDAVGHLSSIKAEKDSSLIQDFVHLKPLGEALLPWTKPRVVLIDELDKSSYDLPNDLLHVLEEGAFEIPEYERTKGKYKGKDVIKKHLTNTNGSVQMHHAPILVITSNGERDFSEAFRRRCIIVEFKKHDTEAMKEVIRAHFKNTELELESDLIQALLDSNLATDAILNAVFLAHNHPDKTDKAYAERLIHGLKR